MTSTESILSQSNAKHYLKSAEKIVLEEIEDNPDSELIIDVRGHRKSGHGTGNRAGNDGRDTLVITYVYEDGEPVIDADGNMLRKRVKINTNL